MPTLEEMVQEEEARRSRARVMHIIRLRYVAVGGTLFRIKYCEKCGRAKAQYWYGPRVSVKFMSNNRFKDTDVCSPILKRRKKCLGTAKTAVVAS